MTRRLIVTVVAIVAAALAVATVVTFVLVRVEAREQARTELRRQAVRLATQVESVQAPGALAAVVRALRLEGAGVLRVGPDAGLRGQLPPGVVRDDIDVDLLRAGKPLTGERAGVLFAAAPAQRGETLVVVLSRNVGAGQVVLGPWFLAIMLATLAAAAAVAVNLGRRLTRPLREAQDATRRIAAGDLAVRVPEEQADGSELEGLARSINVMAASLERSRGLERQFLLSVSHDLRTPLTSIRGYAEALAEDRAPDSARAGAIIAAEAARLERLVGDLLELANFDARRFSLDIRSTDVGEVVADTAEGFRPAADRAGVGLDVLGDPSAAGTGLLPPVAADPDRLAQIVANLVENALKFARSQISVAVVAVKAVTAAPDGDGVAIVVEDDGPGIAAEDATRVFERFYQSSRVPVRQVGSGLGLAIVAELVAAMGGTVRAEPAPRGGTRVIVGLRAWRMAEL